MSDHLAYGAHFAAKMKQALANWPGSIAELARQSQVSSPYIFHLVAGRVEDPSFRRLARISAVLGLPLEFWGNGSRVAPSSANAADTSAAQHKNCHTSPD